MEEIENEYEYENLVEALNDLKEKGYTHILTCTITHYKAAREVSN